MSRPRKDHHVLEPRVCLTIRNYVDESDQLVIIPRSHPSETVPFNQRDPICLRGIVRPKSIHVEGVNLLVLEVSSPFVFARHEFMLRGGSSRTLCQTTRNLARAMCYIEGGRGLRIVSLARVQFPRTKSVAPRIARRSSPGRTHIGRRVDRICRSRP